MLRTSAPLIGALGFTRESSGMLSLEEILSDFENYAESPGLSAAGVTARNLNGETALHWMSVLGDADAIQILVANGAPVNVSDINGNTALHHAVMQRQPSAITALIRSGADAWILNNEGYTPCDLAKIDNYQPTINVLPAINGPRKE